MCVIFTKTIKVVIGFCGGTGAGKSTLVAHAADVLGKGDTLILEQDHYYKYLPELSFEERCAINFDHPDALDFDLLTEHLSQLKNVQTIARPVYSFAQHLRLERQVQCTPKKYILVEGILVFSHQPLHALFDYTVYIDAHQGSRVQRRTERDIRLRGRTAEEVETRFKTTLHAMHEQFIEPSKDLANLIVTNNGALEKATSQLDDWLKEIDR